MPPAYVYPDPSSMVDLPTDEDQNPSIQTSQRGEMDHIPVDNATPFTRSVFPRVVIPYKLLVANLDSHIVEKIEESPPDTFLAVVAFGAGNKFFREHPNANSEVLTFLKTLGIGTNPDLSVARAVARNKPNQRRDFERPWTMVLEGASDELKEFLVWQQTFAVSRDLAFNVLPFDTGLSSWVIMNISGDAVQPGDAAKHKALGEIKKVLWHDPRFRAIADKCLAAQNISGSCSERAVKATNPFNITFIDSDNAQGVHAPIWQLTGRPLSSDPAIQEEFLLNIRSHRYWVGMHMLVIDKRIVNCVWCKSDTHPSHACPFPKVHDWLGPIPTASSNALAQIDSSSSRGRGRGRGNGRGKRGRGDTGRGGTAQGGWKTVTSRRANGFGLDSFRGEGGSSVGNLPEDRGSSLGSGQAVRGQPESGSSQTSTGLLDNERRSAAPTGDTSQVPRVTSGTVQSASASRGNQNGEGSHPPEQSAQSPQSAGGPQSAEPGSRQSTEPTSENGPQATPDRRARRRTSHQCQKNTKAAIRVASLNIKGYRAANETNSKWFHVNQLVRQKRIGILLVQETHLTEERRDTIEGLFSNRLKIHISMDPSRPRSRGGVAIVLNRSLTNVSGAEITEIVPGRALLIRTNWHRAEKISILAVYAPNVTPTDGDENAEFWKTVEDFFVTHPNIKVDMMAGDFNMVEDLIDRLPMRLDPAVATEALESLKNKLNVTDGWRATHPTSKDYTLLHTASDSQSRIDRIYVTEKVLETARDWRIEPNGIPNTDHSIVSVQVAHEAAPNIGRGRWSIPAHILRDKEFREFAHDSGVEALKRLDALKNTPRSEEQNAQVIYNTWKRETLQKGRRRDRLVVPTIQAKIKEKEKTLHKITNSMEIPEDERTRASAEATKELQALERQRHQNSRTQAAVRNRIEGETICRYWTQANKASKPRDMIHALKPLDEIAVGAPGVNDNGQVIVPQPQRQPAPLPSQQGLPLEPPVEPEIQYEKESKRMAELARNYHDRLQSKATAVDPEIRQQKTEQVLAGITKTTSDSQKQDLGSTVTRAEVLEALSESQNNTAAGLDGATYEFWKTLHNRFVEDSKLDRPAFDVVGLMTAAFVDIQQHGLVTATRFADGWMCPLYKKGERTDIANYRPITCLNTDYKIFTKTLASRLAKVAPSLIHHSQAGFIQGRRIADQTKLIRLIFHYAEATEQNGLIVALDQEKAYDKIDHAYLWQTLRKFEIPEEYIRTVQSLYGNAETRIMINGYLSSPWQVTRGVRQGDPLSCLLFDLAIEPLAASLRNSNLKGFEIPGSDEKLIANLFADDTTTFLSEDDEFEDLQALLDDWCIASKAKFNVKKTEVIPIGQEEYRDRVVSTRKTKEGSTPIPEGINIVEDGNAAVGTYGLLS
ncbi:putative RNase H [Lyophyllum shimeji]|uniref:RNase H n=1 Tax=Lyophyllum shimeji TaxID=47721 RepID=A0A9P3Q0X6_LYOSH|nr:putative RNase H [Lyophyllum shimeji]